MLQSFYTVIFIRTVSFSFGAKETVQNSVLQIPRYFRNSIDLSENFPMFQYFSAGISSAIG